MDKECRACHETKDAADFSPDRANRDGLKSYCKPCVARRKRERRAANLEHALAQEAAWRAAHPWVPREPPQPVAEFGTWEVQRNARTQVRAAAKQARRFGARVNDFTFADWVEIIRERKGICYYCGRRDVLQVEHMIPLSRGGDNTRSNITGACKDCNWTKRLRTAEQFAQNLCIHDHPQTPDNVYVYPDGKKTACMTCRRESIRRWRNRKKVGTQ